MYPWSSSSSQQSIPTTASTTTNSNDTTNYNHHLSSNTTNYNHHLSSTNTSNYNNHLTRYGSAPSSVFQTAIDSVFGNRSDDNDFYTGGSCGSADSSGVASSSNTATAINRNNINVNDHHHQSKSISNLQRSGDLRDMMNNVAGGSGGAGGFRNMTAAANSGNGMSGAVGMGDGSGGSSSSNNLTRHSSSPAGFLHQLTSDIGFSITKGIEAGYNNNSRGVGHKLSRLSSQLSFSDNPAADSLNSHISEIDGINGSHHEDHMGLKRSSTTGFSINPWQDGGNSFVISTPSTNNKRAKNNSINDDILNDLSAIDSQFCLPQTTLEMGNMDTMMHNIPHDSVPCKIRAKRGFATHPRSIAERERRTRISGKLKKLQELVPNMDKQTSYADMLDLAVEHIKGLQSQVHKLKEEVECCTCGCKEKL